MHKTSPNFTSLYTVVQSLTTLYKSLQTLVNQVTKHFFLTNTLHNFTKYKYLNKLVKTKLFNTLQYCTILYNTPYNSPRLYNTFHNSTRLYNTIPDPQYFIQLKQFYKQRNSTELLKTIQKLARNCTKLFIS